MPKKPASQEIFGWIEDMYTMGIKRPGTDADHRAEAYLLDKFQQFGLQDCRLEPFDITVWEPKE